MSGTVEFFLETKQGLSLGMNRPETPQAVTSTSSSLVYVESDKRVCPKSYIMCVRVCGGVRKSRCVCNQRGCSKSYMKS